MAKLHFKYGAMASSKTAQALIAKFNYEEKGMRVWLIKPAVDDRDGREMVQSRIGLSEKADLVAEETTDLYQEFCGLNPGPDAVIADECQFFAEPQIDELKQITIDFDVPVLCFGLKTDFATHFFPGSKRLFEIADSLQEIKTVCKCGRKADVNARFDGDGNLITEGEQVLIGGNERYVSMCYRCWRERIQNRGRI